MLEAIGRLQSEHCEHFYWVSSTS